MSTSVYLIYVHFYFNNVAFHIFLLLRYLFQFYNSTYCPLPCLNFFNNVSPFKHLLLRYLFQFYNSTYCPLPCLNFFNNVSPFKHGHGTHKINKLVPKNKTTLNNIKLGNLHELGVHLL